MTDLARPLTRHQRRRPMMGLARLLMRHQRRRSRQSLTRLLDKMPLINRA